MRSDSLVPLQRYPAANLVGRLPSAWTGRALLGNTEENYERLVNVVAAHYTSIPEFQRRLREGFMKNWNAVGVHVSITNRQQAAKRSVLESVAAIRANWSRRENHFYLVMSDSVAAAREVADAIREIAKQKGTPFVSVRVSTRYYKPAVKSHVYMSCETQLQDDLEAGLEDLLYLATHGSILGFSGRFPFLARAMCKAALGQRVLPSSVRVAEILANTPSVVADRISGDGQEAWVCSSGGAGSHLFSDFFNRFRKVVPTTYDFRDINHYPFPPPCLRRQGNGPPFRGAVFLFAHPVDSLYSLWRRGFTHLHATKISLSCKVLPPDIDAFLEEGVDSFGLEAQYDAWRCARVDYPVMLVKCV